MNYIVLYRMERSLRMFEIVIYAFIGFIFVYAITDRVCKCVEHKYATEVIKLTQNKADENAEIDKYIL